jgi:redox-sensitive bicupin YhaK (pirin superfamily)
MRTIRKIHQARYSPIADLITYSPLPSAALQQIDPFLFLNHHGPQKYKPKNNGLPFGPHPHRGMETVTVILAGDILHKDNQGHESVIRAGGVQWMTAGRGLIHAEVSSSEFKKDGGDLEILQLWLNLPSSLKMTDPVYKGVSEDQIPVAKLDSGSARVKVISGEIQGVKGVFDSMTGVNLFIIDMQDKSTICLNVPQAHNIFFYVIRGELYVNTTQVHALQLIEFNNDHTDLHLSAGSQSVILFGHAMPLNEPVVARGPFVMNTEEEIAQAYKDFQTGKFGTL